MTNLLFYIFISSYCNFNTIFKRLNVFVYSLFEKQSERGSSLPSAGSLSLCPATRAGPVWSQEPRTPFGYPVGVAGTEVFGTLSATFSVALTGSWIRRGGPRTIIGTQIRCVGIPKQQFNPLCHSTHSQNVYFSFRNFDCNLCRMWRYFKNIVEKWN